MAEALVNPKSLKAARARAGLSTATLAERLKQAAAKVEEWEAGDARPTFVQARRLASILHTPFALLFIEPGAAEPVALPDLRTVGTHRATAHFSLDLVEVYQDALFKQGWVADERREDIAPVALVVVSTILSTICPMDSC